MAFWDTVIQIIILILALRALHMVSANNSCSEVRRNFYVRVGPAKLTLPGVPYEAKNLRMCPNFQLSCCTRQMEDRFQSQSKKDLKESLKVKTSGMKFNFRSFAANYKGDIVETFLFSCNGTRDVVKKSLRKKIGSRELRASLQEVDRLYQSLGLQSKENDVKKAFERFADKLFLIFMDEEANSSESDLPYERCVAEQRIELHPFMDVPAISATNLSKAIQLARTLHEGLHAGAVAVNVTEGARLSKSCQEALVKMRYCSFCPGLTLLKPCMGLCKNILRGCLAGISELDQYWNHYIYALRDITEQMGSAESKYNLEIALDDFQNKLMTSLTMILENITSLRATVEKQCKSTRTLTRSKRNSDLPTGATETAEENNKLSRRSRGRNNDRRRRGRRPNRYGVGIRKSFDMGLSQLEEEDPLLGQSPAEPPTTPRPNPPLYRPPHEVLTQHAFQSMKRIVPRKSGDRTTAESKKPSSQMHKRIVRFIGTLNSSINFYRHLPDGMCGNEAGFGIEVSKDTKCWEGSEMVKEYDREVIPPGYGKQGSNPEVKVLKVDKDIKKAIEGLRETTKMLLVVSGKTEIPRILLHAPVFERRESEKNLPKNREPKYPCDDEDDCGRNEGSGKDNEYDLGSKKENVEKADESTKPVIEILVGFDKTNDLSRPTNTDRTADEEEKGKGKGDGKCKGGRRKCRRNRGENGKEKSQPKATVTTVMATTSSAQAVANFNFMLWFISVLFSRLTLSALV